MTGVQSVDWGALSPVLAPAVAALLVLLVDAVAGPASRVGGRVVDATALAGLAAGLVLVLSQEGRTTATFCAPARPGLCSYVASPLTLGVQGVALAAALVCLLLAIGAGPAGRRPGAEHHLLLLTATAGAVAVAGSRDLATLLVAVETASLPVVGLVALRRDRRGAEAALKLLLTAVSSFGLMALGVAVAYAGAGGLHLAVVARSDSTLTTLGLVLLVAGLAFKVSLVPFHLWTPDTYAGSPLPVAAFLATVSKVAGATAVVLVLGLGAAARPAPVALVLGVVAAVTMTVGNLVALRQVGAVRLLAWSTVAQAGWVVLPLAGARTPDQLPQATSAALGYLAAYVVASLLAFAVVAAVARDEPDGARHGLEAYRGLLRTRPVLALGAGLALTALAGLPPGVVGLVAKVLALRPVVDAQSWLLVAVAVVNVVLGVAVYLRWLALLPGEPRTTARARPGAAPQRVGAERLALIVAAAATVALSVAPQAVAGLVPLVDALR